jgi:hypothetical protein
MSRNHLSVYRKTHGDKARLDTIKLDPLKQETVPTGIYLSKSLDNSLLNKSFSQPLTCPVKSINSTHCLQVTHWLTC